MEVDETLLDSLIKESEDFPEVRLTSGGIVRDIHRYGSYVEEGLEIGPEDMNLSVYYAGLAILCKDMYEYLPNLPTENTALFEEVLSSVAADDEKIYGSASTFPYADPAFPHRELLLQLPKGMAASAAKGSPTIGQLGRPSIVHEWTLKPGKRLFSKFARKFKETICGKDGPYEQFDKGLLGQAALPTVIAATILKVGFSAATFWYPLAVYIAILLLKTGLKTYCES